MTTLDDIAYRKFKTDYKYIGLDSCRIEVLEEYLVILEHELKEKEEHFHKIRTDLIPLNEDMTDKSKKYVVLEHLQLPNRGCRFWTMNTTNNTRSLSGELWYEEICFTDDSEEAIRYSRIVNKDTIPTSKELEEYWKEQIMKERRNERN
jgi:hypothetical protein